MGAVFPDRSSFFNMSSFYKYRLVNNSIDYHKGTYLSSLQGLVASGVALSLQIWCIDRGGALFTAIFQPVQTVIVAIMAAVILGDELYTGG